MAVADAPSRQPALLRPFTALVVSPEERRRNEFTALVEAAGARRVAAFASGSEARQRARIDTTNDVCVLDGAVADVPVLGFVRQLHALGWRRVILVTARRDSLGVRAALATGIRGYVVTDSPSRAPTGVSAATGGLTDREIEVLQAVADGMTNKQIGEYLGLSSLTVKSHMARIARKLGTGDRAEMVALVMRAGVAH